jgi:hypothetical protein
MAKIICSKVDYLTSENVGGEWIPIKSTGKVEYENKKTNEDAGRLIEETVTVKAFTENTAQLNEDSYKLFFLRLHTDNGYLFVGGQDYPAILSISGNGVTDTLTFLRKSS